MNRLSEEVEAALQRIERAGAGMAALGNLTCIRAEDLIGENTLAGIGYLLEIVGDIITVDACVARDAIYKETGRENPASEPARP
jgi:hypothetical protein